MKDKLKPCPFCASDIITKNEDNSMVKCQGCFVFRPAHLWNNRPNEENLKIALDVLIKAMNFSFDEMINRRTVNARMKESLLQVKKLLGIANSK